MKQYLTKADYQLALDSQSACNLSGIVHGFSNVITKVWQQAREINQGTNWVNTHPICVLYATQIAHLSSGLVNTTEAYGVSYNFCSRMAKGDANE